MKVKIGNIVYDSEIQPILLLLSDEDKKNISSMPDGNTRYCSYPDSQEFTEEQIDTWMKEPL